VKQQTIQEAEDYYKKRYFSLMQELGHEPIVSTSLMIIKDFVRQFEELIIGESTIQEDMVVADDIQDYYRGLHRLIKIYNTTELEEMTVFNEYISVPSFS